jgi:aryl-alcohol dehydrogenase-like predicted oxidoreductase
MKYALLGNTDVRVSRICLGTMTWGEQNSEQEAHEQLDYALDHGVNFIDTAEMYPVPPRAETQGLTEAFIGTWLKKRARRDDVILATKIAGPGDWLKHIRRGSRLSEEHIQQALNDSLKRLKTDYVDLYQLHWPERQTNYFGQLGYKHSDDVEAIPFQQTLQALKHCLDQGKIRHWGLSNETPWGLMTALRIASELGMPAPVSIQNPYNLLNRSFEVGLAECASREQVGLLAYSPLAFGVLTGKYLGGKWPEAARLTLYKRFNRYTHERAEAATQAYNELAKSLGLSLAQLSLAFVNQQSFLTSNIIGATNLEQLSENITSIDVELSNEVFVELDRLHQTHTIPCP